MHIENNSVFKDLYQQAKIDREKRLDAEKLAENELSRRQVVLQYLPLIVEPSIEDYYYAGNIFLLSKTPADRLQAFNFLTAAMRKMDRYDNRELAQNVRQSYAVASDYMLLQNKQPQKYGTIYSNSELIPPHKDYAYDFEKIEEARAQLRLRTLGQQEDHLRKKDPNFRPAVRFNKPDKDDVNDKKNTIKPKNDPVVCRNCKMPGHSEVGCIRPKAPK